MSLVSTIAHDDVVAMLNVAQAAHSTAIVAYHQQNRWATLRSHFIAIKPNSLTVEVPRMDIAAVRLMTDAPLTVAFWMNHAKYFFTSRVQAHDRMLVDGLLTHFLTIAMPDTLATMNRRGVERTLIPANQIVRATFWIGTRKDAPHSTDIPMWSGHVIDFSMSGLMVRTCPSSLALFDPGDTFGMRVTFVDHHMCVNADAVLRHAQRDGDTALLGFRFLTLDQSFDAPAAPAP